MYLHIGYNKVCDMEKVIGIFSASSLLGSEEKSFIHKALNENEESAEKYKSVILYEDGRTEFSKIDAGNLFKRYGKELRKYNNGSKRIYRRKH